MGRSVIGKLLVAGKSGLCKSGNGISSIGGIGKSPVGNSDKSSDNGVSETETGKAGTSGSGPFKPAIASVKFPKSPEGTDPASRPVVSVWRRLERSASALLIMLSIGSGRPPTGGMAWRISWIACW